MALLKSTVETPSSWRKGESKRGPEESPGQSFLEDASLGEGCEQER